MTAYQRASISIYKREKEIRKRVKKKSVKNKTKSHTESQTEIRRKEKLPFIFCTIVLTSGSWMP